MFDAREWLDGVSAAARLIKAHEAHAAAVRSRAAISPQSYDAFVSATGGDTMAQIDAVLAREEGLGKARAEVADARRALSGMALVGSLEADAAAVLLMSHVELEGKKDIARMLGVSLSTVKRRYAYGVDWLDAHGLAHAKTGTGRAQ